MKCEICGLIKPDVSYRSDGYAQDVGNDQGAYHTACDECNYQNNMDI